jgi:hypothetical protein
MKRVEGSTRSHAVLTGILAGAAAVALASVITLAPRPAAAKPEFAAQTGFPCGQCHVNPAGGGTLKPYGQKFKANGFKKP